MKLLIFIVAYNAESHIESVLDRIPGEVWNSASHDVEVLIIDDQSNDRTTEIAQQYRKLHQRANFTILSNPVNQGYGGNQKLGYFYAIRNLFDIVILLHGDGQYAPEMLPDFIASFEDSLVDAVFGSRMMKPRQALQGGMPLYKWFGNRILTGVQNRLLRATLSEFHSGYRAYRVSTLARLPFHLNSPDFDFDTDIIIQLLDNRCRVLEIPIPTYYGDEICRVNGLKYARQIIASTLRSRLQKYALIYHPKFDYLSANEQYTLKLDQASSHQMALDRCPQGTAVLDLGCGPGGLGGVMRKRGCFVMGLDQHAPSQDNLDWFEKADLDQDLIDLKTLPRNPDIVLCLDIIEHLKSPERFLSQLRDRLSDLPLMPRVLITTPNIGFLITRLGLLLGYFNYGKRGILDLTHTRLFTFSTLTQMLSSLGYRIEETRGIPPPLQMALGRGVVGRFCSKLANILSTCWRGLFSYQILIVARPLPTLPRLLDDAHAHASVKQSLEGAITK